MAHSSDGARQQPHSSPAPQRPAVVVQDEAALGGAGVARQRVEGQHPVAQPAPDQRRQHQHQRRHQPQRHAQHQRQQRAARTPATSPAPPAPGRAGLRCSAESAAAPPVAIAGVISQATSSKVPSTSAGTDQRHQDHRRQHGPPVGQRPSASSQSNSAASSSPALQQARTPATAGSQYNQPRPEHGATASRPSGSSDHSITTRVQAVGQRRARRRRSSPSWPRRISALQARPASAQPQPLLGPEAAP
jgi:hypothetical protein